MSDLITSVDTSAEGALMKRGKLTTNDKTIPIPTKAIPNKKLTDQHKILPSTRGVAEFYQEVDSGKLKAFADGDEPAFIDYLEKKRRHLRNDEIVVTFFAYTDTCEMSSQEARALVSLVEEYSDIITPPLQPSLLAAINGDLDEEHDPPEDPFPSYRNGIERFLELADDLETQKPTMGILPLIPDGYINQLIADYESFNVKILGVNLNGENMTSESPHSKLCDIIGRLASLRIFEQRVMYAINPASCNYRPGHTIRWAEDFIPAGMGFDIIGENHVGLGFSPEGEQQNYNVFDPGVAGYQPISVSSIEEDWPTTVESGIKQATIDDISLDQANKLIGLLNAEQIERALSKLRQRIDEGNERNYLRSKKGITEGVQERFDATVNAYENGSGANISSY